ncbi:tRNA (adenine(22)-N(1))-methyltransferase [Sutcliffiella rhizosphaerae]|uniref:tRNA (Adenine(22)-N(1))-methyltransferase n=1 Tax=Sutcliffiella rhizosphaerae TaxID=2880967 RepID=A0ABM8YHR4_9BACI|nr:tRNA (adenine(22)-N(1))-methyltransferase TrmK [Sutcliffiella rhizosphaerae]CAG9619338.1 tRNA (adenine(22)-N(1))-methyltransferase [Sutcliffiella rhizosphaerae]
MNELKLSKRLEAVAAHIPKESILADIGSDHAYLPCYAYLQGIIKSGIAGEVVEGPYQSALQQVRKTELEHVIEVRKGDGLDVIFPNEVTCLTIAGMGGTLIQSILEKGKEKLEGVQTLILQPNIGAKKIRLWLLQNKWELVAETILQEDGRIYEILVAKRGEETQPYKDNKSAYLLVGPFLAKERNEIFLKKWSHELAHWKRIVEQLETAAKSEANEKKMKELNENIRLVEEVLKIENS